jgi:hypothetical protein
MPPLFLLLFVVLFLIGMLAGAIFQLKPLMGSVVPAFIVTGALFLTDWDFTIDARAIFEFFFPAFLCSLRWALFKPISALMELELMEEAHAHANHVATAPTAMVPVC